MDVRQEITWSADVMESLAEHAADVHWLIRFVAHYRHGLSRTWPLTSFFDQLSASFREYSKDPVWNEPFDPIDHFENSRFCPWRHVVEDALVRCTRESWAAQFGVVVFGFGRNYNNWPGRESCRIPIEIRLKRFSSLLKRVEDDELNALMSSWHLFTRAEGRRSQDLLLLVRATRTSVDHCRRCKGSSADCDRPNRIAMALLLNFKCEWDRRARYILRNDEDRRIEEEESKQRCLNYHTSRQHGP